MSRNATLDLARLVAAFGIVLFHCGAPGSSIGYAALPFFTMLLIVLAFPSAARTNFYSYSDNRAKRLLGPWLGWSLFYGLLKLVELKVTGKPLAAEFQMWMLLTGPALHLWFMPFAFFASLAVFPLAKWHPRTQSYNIALLVISVLTLTALWLQQGNYHLASPFAQWLFTLPSVLFGLSFALACGQPDRTRTAAIAAGVITVVSMMAGWGAGVLQFTLATAAMTLCLTIKVKETALSRLASNTALGVYLAHPFILSILVRLTPLKPQTLGFAILCGSGALALTLALALIKSIVKRGRAIDPRQTV